ncbi:hypothetical protein Bca52824_023700 [Brassica carinata]|uniref:Uncharacterized protein n=1 Tax=Brassica carinata TaxID=52824 RepID=A0A8X8AUX5_BRACI|nr:hypothetical protein Bca52824_023700 [Brassica carinata]
MRSSIMSISPEDRLSMLQCFHNRLCGHSMEFFCRRVVESIDTTNGWCYTSCSSSKNLSRGSTSFTCGGCNKDNAVGGSKLILLKLMVQCPAMCFRWFPLCIVYGSLTVI